MTPPSSSLLVLAGALPDAGWLAEGLRTRASRDPVWMRFASGARLIDASIEAIGSLPEPGHLRFLARRLALESPAAWPAAELAEQLQMNPERLVQADGRARHPASSQALWRLQPVHFLLGRDHIRLLDPSSLELDEADALALLESVQGMFADEGIALGLHSPGVWWAQAIKPDSALQLQAFSLAGAIGRSIEARLPAGPHARRWRRLLNECQMIWHSHPVNEARQSMGHLPINGLWIEGPAPNPLQTPGDLQRPPGSRPALQVETRLLQAQSTGDPQAWVEAWSLVCQAHLGARPDPFTQILLAGDCGWRLIASNDGRGWISTLGALIRRTRHQHERWLQPF